jgi:hypothetical protein
MVSEQIKYPNPLALLSLLHGNSTGKFMAALNAPTVRLRDAKGHALYGNITI